MDFLDEEDRLAAARTGKQGLVAAAIAFVLLVGVYLFVGPIVGFLVSVIAVPLAGWSVATLRHPEASVIGGLRVLGFVLAGVVLLIGAAEVGYLALKYLQQQQDAEMMNRANSRLH